MRFEYWNSGDGTWTWQLKSAVGEVIAHGGPLDSAQQCKSAIKLVKLAAAAPMREIRGCVASGQIAARELDCCPSD